MAEQGNDFDVDKDGDIDMNDVKHIYLSKTFWVNVIAIVGFGLQQKFGYMIDPGMQVQILGVINIILRSVTHGAVSWTKPVKPVKPEAVQEE